MCTSKYGYYQAWKLRIVKNLLPLVWLVDDFFTVEVFLVVALSLDWLVDGAGLDRKSEKKKWVIT